MPIYFYSTREAYGCCSNFSAHGFELDGPCRYSSEGACAPRLCRYSSEHYFPAQKLAGHPQHMEALGKTGLCEFETHADIRQILLSTGEQEIIENAPGDYYWGCGQEGTGKNMLGIILMESEVLRKRGL